MYFSGELTVPQFRPFNAGKPCFRLSWNYIFEGLLKMYFTFKLPRPRLSWRTKIPFYVSHDLSCKQKPREAIRKRHSSKCKKVGVAHVLASGSSRIKKGGNGSGGPKFWFEATLTGLTHFYDDLNEVNRSFPFFSWGGCNLSNGLKVDEDFFFLHLFCSIVPNNWKWNYLKFYFLHLVLGAMWPFILYSNFWI